MNYLAHVLLSCHDKDLMAGNFIADFLTIKEVKSQPDKIIKGIELHKSIDSYTDQHSAVKSCVLILRPTQGKYSPVIIDILFDYFLTKNWAKFCSIDLVPFITNVYSILNENKESFPEKLKNMLPIMIADDFLMSCANEERLSKTFLRLKKRVKFKNHFESILLDLKNHSIDLEFNFLAFFPDLVKHVNSFCKC